jgi:hypothetical protein
VWESLYTEAALDPLGDFWQSTFQHSRESLIDLVEAEEPDIL